MAQDIVSGLFGPAPYQIQRQQDVDMDLRADRYASQDPFQRATGTMYRAGGMLGNMGAQAMGMVNPQVEEAKMTEAALSGLDINDPKAIYGRAQQINEPRLKMKLMMLAQQKAAEIQKLQLEAQKGALAERKHDEAFALKKMEAEARIRQNDDRIADARTNAQERNQLMRENNQIKMMIAQMKSGQQGMTANELRQQKYEDTKEKESQAKVDAAKAGIDTLDAVKRNVLDLYDEKTGQLKPAASTLFGRVDQFRGPLTLSENSANALSSLTGLKDQITMTNLADAKKMVGQSFGSMQVQEWDKFVRLLASLDRSIGEKKAAENLKYIYDFITKKSDVLQVALGGKKDSATWNASTPDEVKALYKAGTITKEQAKAILKDMGV